MTVELGNINKGIPMGSYAPGEGGGGGTAKVTGVDPIAVTNGSVAIKIDEQTLQVNEQGELAANLDEIGNELNDLSGRVTAAEADILNKANKIDLDKKENKITTTGALTLTEKVISNLNGMSITTDGVGAYSTTGTYLGNGRESWNDSDRILGAPGTTGYFVPGEYTADSWRGGYIDMPYTFGYTIKMPLSAASIYGYAGKYDADGRFIPITKVTYDHNSKSLAYSDTLTLEKEDSYDWTVLRGQASAASGKTTYISTSGGRNNYGWTISDKNYGYLQWLIESNGTVTQIWRDGQTTDGRFYVALSTSAATEAIERWKEVTVIRFAPTYNDRDNTYGVSANPFPVADFGTYPTDKRIYEYASEAELVATGNLFDISGQTAHNYLELGIGDGLAVQDNKLVCTVEAPDAYTKAEADTLLDNKATKAEVAKKQDALTAVAPINVEVQKTNPVKGYNVTDTTITSQNTAYINGLTTGSSSGTSAYASGSVPFDSQVVLPFSAGQVVNVPYANSNNRSNGQVILGHLNSDGVLVPCIAFSISWANVSTYPSDNKQGFVFFPELKPITSSSSTSLLVRYPGSGQVVKHASWEYTRTDGEDNSVFVQLLKTSDTQLKLTALVARRGNTVLQRHQVIFDDSDNYGITTEQLINNISVAVFLTSSGDTLDKTRFGVYDYTSELPAGAGAIATVLANRGENLAPLGDPVVQNLVSLSIGDGLSITDGKLTATGGSSTSVEKYGIEGDYSSKYGILECPNGIFAVSDMTMTLQPGVVMQCAGSESKTTNSSAMAHTVTATSDFDIFYTSGQFIEATQVVFSTEEPDDGDTGYIAWWDPSREDKKWQFKSNDTGNVWAAAAACRLAHVHTDGTTITRVDYIGNRQMDDSVFVDASTLDGISFKKLTQSAYDAIDTPDANTLYIIVG